MARRRRSNKNSDGGLILQIMALIFVPIFLMLGSRNPIVKAIGGILLFVIFVGVCCASNGITFEESGPFLLLLLILGFVLLFVVASRSSGKSDGGNNNGTTNTSRSGANIKTATLNRVDSPAPASALPKVQSARPFEELFTEMETEIRSVVGSFGSNVLQAGKTQPSPKEQPKNSTDTSISNKSFVSTGNENGVNTKTTSVTGDNKKKSPEKTASPKSVHKTAGKTSDKSIKPQVHRNIAKKSDNSFSVHSASEKRSIHQEPIPISVATIDKTKNVQPTKVLPKIILPESNASDVKSNEKVSYTIDTSFMNPPVENEQDNEVRASGTVYKKDEFFFDSVAEAVSAYKVPDNYKKIMIRRIENTDISECPALIWKEKGYLKVLPLLREAKIFQWRLKNIPIVIGERRYDSDYDNEYVRISGAGIGKEFTEFFPEYPFGNRGVYTDIFTLPVGLSVTNTSAKSLFSLIEAEFYIDDEITKSEQYVPAIKKIYRKHFLYENHVISVEEYNNAKEEILEEYLETERSDGVYRTQIKHLQKLQL